ncbi:hypothetical protein PYR78_03330 [Acinetobacter johnsonii]|nr:hypothetical protein PYR78_03330 [Acinetobacter johnsonii]
MTHLSLIDKNSHIENELANNTGLIQLSSKPTVVKLNNLTEKIVEIKKENNDVVITSKMAKKLS